MKYSNITDKLVKLRCLSEELCAGDMHLQLWLYYSWMIAFINMQIEIYSLCCNCEYTACSSQLNAQVKMSSPINDADILFGKLETRCVITARYNKISSVVRICVGSSKWESLTFKVESFMKIRR